MSSQDSLEAVWQATVLNSTSSCSACRAAPNSASRDPPRLNFLFLLRSSRDLCRGLPAKLWHMYFQDAELTVKRSLNTLDYRVYVHVADRTDLVNESDYATRPRLEVGESDWLELRRAYFQSLANAIGVPSEKLRLVPWTQNSYGVDLVTPMLQLLRCAFEGISVLSHLATGDETGGTGGAMGAADRATSNDYFIYVSESTIPVKSFSDHAQMFLPGILEWLKDKAEASNQRILRQQASSEGSAGSEFQERPCKRRMTATSDPGEVCPQTRDFCPRRLPDVLTQVGKGLEAFLTPGKSSFVLFPAETWWWRSVHPCNRAAEPLVELIPAHSQWLSLNYRHAQKLIATSLDVAADPATRFLRQNHSLFKTSLSSDGSDCARIGSGFALDERWFLVSLFSLHDADNAFSPGPLRVSQASWELMKNSPAEAERVVWEHFGGVNSYVAFNNDGATLVSWAQPAGPWNSHRMMNFSYNPMMMENLLPRPELALPEADQAEQQQQAHRVRACLDVLFELAEEVSYGKGRVPDLEDAPAGPFGAMWRYHRRAECRPRELRFFTREFLQDLQKSRFGFFRKVMSGAKLYEDPRSHVRVE